MYIYSDNLINDSQTTQTTTRENGSFERNPIGIAISHVVFSQQGIDVGFLICSDLSCLHIIEIAH
jgi:hypothetical protein